MIGSFRCYYHHPLLAICCHPYHFIFSPILDGSLCISILHFSFILYIVTHSHYDAELRFAGKQTNALPMSMSLIFYPLFLRFYGYVYFGEFAHFYSRVNPTLISCHFFSFFCIMTFFSDLLFTPYSQKLKKIGKIVTPHYYLIFLRFFPHSVQFLHLPLNSPSLLSSDGRRQLC